MEKIVWSHTNPGYAYMYSVLMVALQHYEHIALS